MEPIIIYEESELWGPVENFSNYEISNRGRIKNIKTKRILKPWATADLNSKLELTNNDGKCKTVAVKNLVAKCFVENPHNFTSLNTLI